MLDEDPAVSKIENFGNNQFKRSKRIDDGLGSTWARQYWAVPVSSRPFRARVQHGFSAHGLDRARNDNRAGSA